MTESSKRRRVNSSPLDNSRSESTLTCVRVVCQNGPDILSLPHVVTRLDEFLDNSWKWTFPKACASDSPYLVERLLLRHAAEAPARCWYHPDYRQWQFDTCLEEAAKVENLKIVQLLEMNFRDCCVSKNALENAIRRGLSDIVMWLVENGYNVNCDAETVLVAIGNRQLKLAKWLKGRIQTTIVDKMTEWTVAAASKGDLGMVKDLFNERDANGGFRFVSAKVDVWRVVQSATNWGQLDVLKWIMDEMDRNIQLHNSFYHERRGNSIVFFTAAARGHLAVLAWLIRNYPTICKGSYAHYYAAKNGHLGIVRLLLSSGIQYRGDLQPVDAAVENGHLEIAKCLVAERFSTTRALFIATVHGCLDDVKWLHENTVHHYCVDSMDDAAGAGHLDIVRWLDYSCDQGCTVDAMDNAAANGCLHVVQWLHEHRTEGCTTEAMNEAASNGNLEMVKWLHFNRREGCTTNAMDFAAAYGHLDVVKWLHVNRSEGCTTEAMDNAARHNHLDVLQWLDQNRTEGFTSDARDNAVSQGNWEVYEWLTHRRPELCLTAMANTHNKIFYAASEGHFAVVWFLYKNFCSINALRDALTDSCTSDTSSLNLTFKFADWAYIHHRDEFELNIAEHLFC